MVDLDIGKSVARHIAEEGIIGVLDGFRRAQIYAGTEFNLTSFTGLALCFVVVTFPMTRLADRLLKRDAARLQAGAR